MLIETNSHRLVQLQLKEGGLVGWDEGGGGDKRDFSIGSNTF